jgi:tetratricopeptide (TPR) repeat protein
MAEDTLLNQAMAAYKAGKKDAARKLLMQFVEIDTRNETAWLLLSELVPDLEDKIIALENALAVNSRNSMAREQLERLRTDNLEAQIQAAGDAINDGQRNKALGILRQLVESGQGNEQVWLLLSELVQEPKNKRAALRQVLKLNPENKQAQSKIKELLRSPDDLFARAGRHEQNGEYQEAINTYIQISMNTDSPSTRLEAERRMSAIKIQLEAPGFRQVSPRLSLIRMTVGPILLYAILILLHGGFNPLRIPLVFWIGLVSIVMGSYLTNLTSTPSAQFLLQKFWGAEGENPSTPKKMIKFVGIILSLLPYGLLLMDGIQRLRVYLNAI